MSDQEPEYFRSEYADEDLVPFDARDDSGRRAMWLLLGLVGAFMIAAIIVFNLYQSGVRDRESTPLITADNTPYKVEPENTDEAPKEESAVYEAMKGNDIDDEIITAPLPEDPVELPDAATIIVDGKEPAVKDTSAETKPVAKPKVEPKQPTKPTPKPRASADSDYVVQVASVRSRADAQSIWSTVETKFKSNLPRGSYSDIKRVDLGSKGIYFRLRVAGLKDKSAADSLCNTFKSQSQACFVTRK